MVWSEVFPILFGAGISLVSSLTMFGLATWYDQKKKSEEKHSERGTAAVIGLHKLMKTLDFIENMARHIDNEFSDMERNNGIADPSSLVRPIVGSRSNFEMVSASEMSFLSESDGELVARIYEIQQRALNIDAIIGTYNELRLEHDRYLQQHLVSIDGLEVTVELEGKDALVANMSIGRLNQLVAGLIELLDKDRVTIKSVVTDYLKEAQKVHPKQFSKAELITRTRQ
jgi:hypothetical protein